MPRFSSRLRHGRTHQQRRIRASTACVTHSSSHHDALFREASPEESKIFSSIKRWIVFSDLHVHERFHPYWSSSLNSVSKIAAEHNAGCIFLVEGDLRDWRHPTISITGNHDQASLSGAEHNMGILERICPMWRVFSAPTLLNNAAWIPYRAERKELQQLLAAARELPEAPLAFFVHADVAGARFNTRQQAHVGVDQAEFPADTPTYSGHYHLPHTVPNTNITYIGSPFQLNFGEEGETKRVLLLDEHFQPLQSIPLSCGPQHHSLQWSSRDEWLPDCNSRFDSQSVLRLTAPASEQAAVAKAREQLAATGARVSVILEQPLLARLQPTTPTPSNTVPSGAQGKDKDQVTPGHAPESPVATALLTPTDTLHAFLDYRQRQAAAGRDDSAEAISAGEEALQQQLRQQALAILQRCQDSHAADGDSAAAAARVGAHAAPVQLAEVTVQGFRCFGAEPVTFSFGAAGIVALTGRNDLDQGSLSNGSGKTAIASAAIWALSGDLSGWLGDSGRLGLTRADVINHSPAIKAARVRLSGSVAGEQFTVERSATKHKGALMFEMGGKDETGATLRETQAAIDRRLSPHLPRVMFHSQATVMGLLEAADTKFKDALAPVVDLSLWKACEDEAKALSKESKTACIAAAADVQHSRRAVDRAADRATAASAALGDATQQAQATGTAADTAAAAAAAAAAPLPQLLAQARTAAEAVQARVRGAEAEQRRVWAGAAEVPAEEEMRAQDTAGDAEADQEAAREEKAMNELQKEVNMRARGISERQAVSSAAAADLAAARQRAAATHAHLAAAQQDERALLVAGTHSSEPEVEEQHCELCGQALRGEAVEVTRGKLSEAVDVAEGRCAAAEAAVAAAEEASVAATQALEELEMAQQETLEREARHRERWAQLVDTARAARRAREEAAQAQRALTAALDADIKQLNSVATDLLLCCGKVESAQALFPQRTQHAQHEGAEQREDMYVTQAGHAAGVGAPHGRNAWRWGPQATAADVAADPEVGGWRGTPGSWLSAPVAEVAHEARRLREEVDAAVRAAHAAHANADKEGRRLDMAHGRWQEKDKVARETADELQDRTNEAEAAERALAAAEARAALHAALGAVFGRGGVQHFEVDGVVRDLAARTEPLLRMLAPQFQLQLHTVRPEASTKQTDTIEKRLSRVTNGQVTQEGLFLGSLSTGERRRVALALALGYLDLLRARGAAAADTLVLDEVHANLDSEGVRRVLDVLRTLSQRCVVVVGQAGSEVADLADRHEAVVKRADGSVALESQF